MAEGAPMDVDTAGTFDLEAYISNYAGHAKAERLLHIYREATDPELRRDALETAIKVLKQGMHVDRYRTACDLAAADPNVSAEFDAHWVHMVETQAAGVLEKLEDDLSSARTNGIREVIRQLQMDLGHFHYSRGDFAHASKVYMRTRDFCATGKQMLAFCLAVIRTYAAIQNWTMVATYVQKAESLADVRADDAPTRVTRAQLAAAAGLAALCSGRYGAAAAAFSDVGADMGSSFAEVVAPCDVALYGALTALAKFDRAAIRSRLLARPGFSGYLESVPQVRELLEAFCSSRYAEAFQLLEALRPLIALDPRLTGHEALTRAIRCRALCEFVMPFRSLRMGDMADALGTPLTALESEVAALITDGSICARIDSHKKILYKQESDVRRTTVARVLEAADAYIATAHALLLRSQLAQGQLRPALPAGAKEEAGRGLFVHGAARRGGASHAFMASAADV